MRRPNASRVPWAFALYGWRARRILRAYCRAIDDDGERVRGITGAQTRRILLRRFGGLCLVILVGFFDFFGARTASERVSERGFQLLTAPFFVSWDTSGRPKTASDIAVILVDPASIRRDERSAAWPIGFERYARMVRFMNDLDPPPRAVFFDIFWTADCGGRGDTSEFVDAILNKGSAPVGDVTNLFAKTGEAEIVAAPRFPVLVGGALPLEGAYRAVEFAGPGGGSKSCAELEATGGLGVRTAERALSLEQEVLPSIADVTCVVPISWQASNLDAYPMYVDRITGKTADAGVRSRMIPMPARMLYDLKDAGAPADVCTGHPRTATTERGAAARGPVADMSVLWRIDTQAEVAFLYGKEDCGFEQGADWSRLRATFDLLVGATFGNVIDGTSHDGRRPCPPNGGIPYDLLMSGGDAAAQVGEFLAGKFVLVGTSAELTGDDIIAPGHGRLPGVYFHAMALDNLLAMNDDYINYPTSFLPTPFDWLTLADVCEALFLAFVTLIGLPLAFLQHYQVRVTALPVDEKSHRQVRVRDLRSRRLRLDLDLAHLRAAVSIFAALIVFVYVVTSSLHYSPANWAGLGGAVFVLVPGLGPAIIESCKALGQGIGATLARLYQVSSRQ